MEIATRKAFRIGRGAGGKGFPTGACGARRNRDSDWRPGALRKEFLGWQPEPRGNRLWVGGLDIPPGVPLIFGQTD